MIKYVNFYYTRYLSKIDSGIIYEDIKISESKIGIESMRADFDLRENSNVLAYINFYSSPKVRIVQKSYIKLTIVFAELGGLIKITFLLFGIISLPFLNKKKNLKIMNEFYKFYEDDNYNTDNRKIGEIIKMKELELKNIDSSGINLKKEKEINNKGSNRKIFSLIPIKKEKEEADNSIPKNIKLVKTLKKQKIFTNCEIFKTSYLKCFKCCIKNLKEKNIKYDLSTKCLKKITDFLEIVKFIREFKVLKYLLFNNIQQKSFDYVSNLKIGDDMFNHLEEYQNIIKEGDELEKIKILNNYYKMKINENNLSKIDEKLFSLFHPKIKNLIGDLN
jgi:hypothetical protein